MNNKKIGNDFEREFVKLLTEKGFWVHFIEPKPNGSQPFDVIAVKNNDAYVFDCKTCVSKWFSIDRLQDNQVMSFEKWLSVGNTMPYIAIKYKDTILLLPYDRLKEEGKINLDDEFCGFKRYKGI